MSPLPPPRLAAGGPRPAGLGVPAGEGRGETALPRSFSFRRGLPAGWIADLADLARVRLNTLVLFTVFAGFAAARGRVAPQGVAETLACFHLLLGTWLLACGASVLNQLLEHPLDRRMHRTARRPLARPAAGGRWPPAAARALGMAASASGLALLGAGTNLLVAALGAATAAVYLFAYTPLKPRSSLALFAGAVAGATPPLMGWAAATGGLAAGAWALFALLYLWQVPHFLAISWIHREDYRRAGYRVLAAGDATGRLTGLQALSYSLLLVPASLFPAATAVRAAGTYLAGATTLGVLLAGAAACFTLRPRPATARALFVASLLYLPLLLAVLLASL